MIDQPTFKEIKMLHSQGHTFTFITMSLDLEDETVEAVLQSKSYAEYERPTKII
jgi:hypothetical protein